MAEIGLIASVISVAGAGIKLSITLYTFSETVATAADSIKAIAKDVSLTSAVLEELSSNLKHDEQARLYSGTALKTAQTVVVDCEAVFKQIDGALSKSMERIGGLAGTGNRKGKGGKVVLSAMEKLKWPFLQPKMQELRANLERLKSTLVLMLNVLTYARKVQTEKHSQTPKDDYQRLLIENLVAANQEATRNFQTLLRTIGPGDETSSIRTTSTRELSIGGSTLGDRGPPLDQLQTRSIIAEEVDSKRPRDLETNSTGLSRGMPESGEDKGNDQFTISGSLSATETTMACLKRIQQALDQFEASEDSLKSARQLAVSIEVYKHMLQPDKESRKREPWEVASIVVRSKNGDVRDEPYDPYIPSGAPLNTPVAGQISNQQRTAALQAQIDDTVGVMRENINKVSQRGERLDSLQDETENLSVTAQRFRRAGNRVRKQRGWLNTLGSAWNKLPSASAAIASADEFLQEKFAAAFYNDEPEEAVDSTLPPSDVPGPVTLKPMSPESHDILPSLPSDKSGHDNEQSSSSVEAACRACPYGIHDETLPVTMPAKAPTRQWPVSRVAVSPPQIPDMQEHASTPSESENRDTNLAHDAEAENKPTRLTRRTPMGRSSRQGSAQGDNVLISYLHPNRPEIARQAGQIMRESESESESECATEDGAGVASGLDVRTETGRDGSPSVESLLKEWTTLYD